MQIHAMHALSEYRPYKLAGYHTCMHVVATQTELPTEGSVICNTSVTDFESCTCDECYLHATDLHFDYNDALQHECPIEHYVDCSFEESITDNVDTSLSELRDYVVQSTEADELRRDHQHTVIQSVEQCCGECNKLKEEKRRLLVSLNGLQITEETMKSDEKKVTYYTGLPNFNTLLVLLNFVTVSPQTLSESKCKLSIFQQIMVVLMKLRLNLEEQDLAYRFNVSQSTVSKTFHKWIPIMAERLHPLIYWPSKQDIRATLPTMFHNFFHDCVCIIDCTEVFIERPSNLVARAQTWSNYKHHNTVKVLIGITPQGTISFLSKAWGGRASDKFMTEHSGFLDRLHPGDLILADRGFTIEESVGLYCARVSVPPFTKGRKQLTRLEVDRAREISHVRIHVERVIGQLKKKYTILQGVIPITLLQNRTGTCTIDCIFTVSAALCNMCQSVVSFD